MKSLVWGPSSLLAQGKLEKACSNCTFVGVVRVGLRMRGLTDLPCRDQSRKYKYRSSY